MRSASSWRRRSGTLALRLPPHVGLAGPATIGHIVGWALVRAGLRTPSRRGAAHLFRHGLATRIDFETLRGVARPWPRACAR